MSDKESRAALRNGNARDALAHMLRAGHSTPERIQVAAFAGHKAAADLVVTGFNPCACVCDPCRDDCWTPKQLEVWASSLVEKARACASAVTWTECKACKSTRYAARNATDSTSWSVAQCLVSACSCDDGQVAVTTPAAHSLVVTVGAAVTDAYWVDETHGCEMCRDLGWPGDGGVLCLDHETELEAIHAAERWLKRPHEKNRLACERPSPDVLSDPAWNLCREVAYCSAMPGVYFSGLLVSAAETLTEPRVREIAELAAREWALPEREVQ